MINHFIMPSASVTNLVVFGASVITLPSPSVTTLVVRRLCDHVAVAIEHNFSCLWCMREHVAIDICHNTILVVFGESVITLPSPSNTTLVVFGACVSTLSSLEQFLRLNISDTTGEYKHNVTQNIHEFHIDHECVGHEIVYHIVIRCVSFLTGKFVVVKRIDHDH